MHKISRYNTEEVITGIAFVIMIAVLAVILVGAAINAQNRVDEGEIVNKQIIRWETDKTVFQSVRYTFTIEGERQGKPARYTFEVTEKEYESYKIGDWYRR